MIIDNQSQNVAMPSVIIEPRRGLFDLDLPAVWHYRQLLYFLVWRDLKVRYKQTVIGVAWAVLQPLVTMVLFTVIFGNFAKLPSDNYPYAIFSYCGLLPWSYFASALSRSTGSVVGDANLIKKVYFPRLILPVAGTISGLIDFLVSFIILVGMMTWYGIHLSWSIIFLPVFLLFSLVTALAVGLWLSALNVRYRDVAYTIPFLVQSWMFASPVVYSITMIPEKYRLLYSFNPMAGVIEGFRWALLGKAAPDFMVMAVSAVVVLVLLAGGLIFFKNMERTFADVV